ncbi:MAG: ZPR1 zinc finger domain-containing protein [Promethearchaeota archaeon]
MTPPVLPAPEKVDLARPISCPSCQEGNVSITKTIYKFPRTEETMCFLLFECNKCSFRKNDTVPLETEFGAGIFSLKVLPGDLTAKIFRSPHATVRIPELGVDIEPGPSAEFMLTNVEGLLERVAGATRVLSDGSRDPGRVRAVLDAIAGMLAGKRGLTVIIEDPEGGSYIAPPSPELLNFKAFGKN